MADGRRQSETLVNSFSQIQWECSQNETSMGFHWNLALTRQLKEINQVTTAHFTQKLKKQSEIIESYVLSCHNLNHVHPPSVNLGEGEGGCWVGQMTRDKILGKHITNLFL